MNFKFANDFNVYTLNDHKQSNVDSEGRVAVAGDATYSNYGIGSHLTTSLTRADLIVGGQMNITGGTNAHGNSVISDLNNVVNYTMTNNNGVLPQPIQDSPIDFVAQNEYLKCASTNWALLTPNGTAQVLFGGLTLIGLDPTLNIFSLNGNNIEGSGLSLSMLNKIDIVAPIGSTILVNISGTNLGFGNYGMFRNGITATGYDGQYILWNLYECLTLNAGSTSVKGSLLAPLATYDSGYTNIEGTIMVNNLYGNIEAHNYLFKGTLPEVCADTTTSTDSTTSTTTTDSTTTDSTTTNSTSTNSTTSTTTESTSSTTDSTTTTDSTSTESTTTTTMTTTTLSTTTIDPNILAVNNLINSVANEQDALSSIIEAESLKIKFAIENCPNCKDLICINKSVENMMTTITNLEIVLANKLKIGHNFFDKCE